MATKLEFVRKLQKAGRRSYTLNIPLEVAKRFGWRERQKLLVTAAGRGRLMVADWKKGKK